MARPSQRAVANIQSLQDSLKTIRTQKHPAGEAATANHTPHRPARIRERTVHAGPPSHWYRFRKYARRNRGVLATVMVIAAVVLAGLGISLWQTHQAELARKDAEEQRERAEQALQDADAQREQAEAGYRYTRDAIKKLLSRVAYDKIANIPGMREVYVGVLQDAISSYSDLIDMKPEDVELYLERGNINELLRNHENVERDFEMAVKIAPDNFRAHYRLAYELAGLLSGRSRSPEVLERALSHATRASELQSDFKDARVLKVRLLSQLKRHSEMQAEIAYIERQYELTPVMLHGITSALISVGEDEAGLKYALESVAQDHGTPPGCWTLLAQILDKLGRTEEALDAITKSIDSDGINHATSQYTIRFRSEINMRLNRYKDALVDLDKYMEMNPSHTYLDKRRAVCHFRLGNYDQALEYLDRRMEVEPTDTSTLVWISPTEVANCPDDNFRQGIFTLMTKWIESPNSNPGYHSARASLYQAMGQPELAQTGLKVALASPTAPATTFYAAAIAALVARDSDGYQQTAREMVERFQGSDDFDSLYWTVWTAVVAPGGVGREAELLALAKKAVAEQPMDIGALQGLGALHFRLGEFAAASEQLTAAHEALQTGPIDSAAACTWYFLAMTEHQLGNDLAARYWLEKASEYHDSGLGEDLASPGTLQLDRKLTLDLLDAEAKALMNPDEPAVQPM